MQKIETMNTEGNKMAEKLSKCKDAYNLKISNF
jgi:hypothetical protein